MSLAHHIRRAAAGAGGVSPSTYCIELLFPGTTNALPNPSPNTGTGNDCTFTGTAPFYGNDASSQAFQAAVGNATDNSGKILNSTATDRLWFGGNTLSFDMFAIGYGEAGGGRILDHRNPPSPGHATFVSNSGGLKLNFLIEDSTGFKFWTIDNALTLSTWYQNCSIAFDSADKANVPVFSVSGVPVASSLTSDTTGGATGGWGSDAGNDTYVLNNIGGDRAFDGRLDNIRFTCL